MTDIVTFGCRLNACESEIIRGHARAAGLERAVIVNTCAVTAEAERQARQAIRRARREHPDSRIIVTGCAAEIDPARFRAMPEVDAVVGNGAKLKAETWGAPAALQAETVSGFEGRARAFFEVQHGCDHRCTFCVIPFGRGASRSVPLGAVVERVRALAAGGMNEVVLSGVDLTSHGLDLPGRPTLGNAVRRLLALVPELPRLRLSSLDPAEIDDELVALYRDEPRLMPHAHLSLQAGDDLILKRMKRRHTAAQAVAMCGRLRAARPDIAFGADLIAGFPTETDALFDNTLRHVDDCGLAFLHVFPFSARPGTPAARMPQVAGAVRRARAARLRARGAERLAALLDAAVGCTARVLVETPRTGRTEHYAIAALDRNAAPGSIVTAMIAGRAGDRLEARIAQ
jgi:threonylcarbamoyladenosine tRNA methylthiotransferase MtaB